MSSSIQKEFILGSLIGGAIGAAAMLLLTPMSGEKLRKEVRTHLDKLHLKRKQAPSIRIKALARRKAKPNHRRMPSKVKHVSK